MGIAPNQRLYHVRHDRISSINLRRIEDQHLHLSNPDLSASLIAEQCFCTNCCPDGSSRQSGYGAAQDDAEAVGGCGKRAGLRDRDSGAYNLAYFADYAGKEFYKARRYGRQFSLLLVSVDNLEQLRREAGREPDHELPEQPGRDRVRRRVGSVTVDAGARIA